MPDKDDASDQGNLQQEDTDPTDEEDPTYLNLPEHLFNPTDYQGFLEADSLASTVGTTDAGLSISEPSKNRFSADGYFSLNGTVNVASDTGYYWLRVIKASSVSDWTADFDEETSYWLTGNFDYRIWLRFGPGDYTIGIIRIGAINVNENGVISSWSYYTPPVQTFYVSNQNQEDGRYLYPSAVIQNDAAALLTQAMTVSEGSDYARVYHDWVVKHIAYDVNNVYDGEPRRKQDALSALDSGIAVCEGYATLYAALMRAVKVPAQYITGFGDGNGNGVFESGESHAWNSIQQGGSWYYVDTTWDDPLWNGSGHSDYPDGENLRDTYFMSATLWDDHVEENVDIGRSLKAETSMEYPGYPDGWY